jgi:hypothetical protein
VKAFAWVAAAVILVVAVGVGILAMAGQVVSPHPESASVVEGTFEVHASICTHGKQPRCVSDNVPLSGTIRLVPESGHGAAVYVKAVMDDKGASGHFRPIWAR